MRETRVRSLGWEDPLEKEWQPTPVLLKIPWTEEPGRLQSMGSQRVRHDWVTSLFFLLIKHNIFLGPQRTYEPWKLPAMCTGWVALREISELFFHKVAHPPQHTHTHKWRVEGYWGLEGEQGCGSGWGEGLTSPLGHEWVHIHEESQQLERDLEPGLFPREQNHHHHLDHKHVQPSPVCQKEHILYNLLGPKPTSPLPLGSCDSLDNSPRLRG